jgi:hypothetical protein
VLSPIVCSVVKVLRTSGVTTKGTFLVSPWDVTCCSYRPCSDDDEVKED